MKKLFLVIALVAAYGITISNASAKFENTVKSDITIVADSDDNSVSLNNDEDPLKKKAEAKACCPGTAAKATTAKSDCCPATAGKAATGECAEAGAKTEKAVGCSEAQVKSCAASKTTCAGENK
ncbi:MAG: hypothetical protein GQ525_01565 [Draconibacterium sp.]|nr:hypothetical protein [Draconibacterium sp.]